MPPGADTRCGFIALIGAPNVGKSTLLNSLVGAKVAIVTHKVQTTRALLRGIAIEGAAQLVFIDTPGIFAPRRRLDRAMVTTAWSGAHDADIVAVLIDAKSGLNDDAEALLRKLEEVRQPKVLILNKVDLVPRPDCWRSRQRQCAAKFLPQPSCCRRSRATVSGTSRRGSPHVPAGPWHYPADEISTAARHLAAEITREKLFLRLHEELPYRSTVATEQWKELKDGSVRIEQTIMSSAKASARSCWQGRPTIKAIGAEARREIATIVERQCNLFLFVKVRGLGRRSRTLSRHGAAVSKE